MLPKKLKGISAGRLNTAEGPDFTGAEFMLNGVRYRGDVEIHLRRSDWYSHKHHLDKHYNRVVLHLVLDKDEQPVHNFLGQSIPTVSISGSDIGKLCGKWQPACRLKNPQSVSSEILQKLALKRLVEKSLIIKKRLEQEGPDASLYYYFIQTFGLKYNSAGFQKLAAILPWPTITLLKQKNNLPPEFWQALYFGAAGLLSPAQKPELADIWKTQNGFLSGLPLSPDTWVNGGIRPAARPAKSLLIISSIIHRLKSKSLFYEFYTILAKRHQPKDALEQLHSFFNTAGGQLSIRCGPQLRSELIGNVILPFFYCQAKLAGSAGFAYYLQDLYFLLNAPGVYQRIQPLYKSLENAPKKFYTHQALLYLHGNYCLPGRCSVCPLLTENFSV